MPTNHRTWKRGYVKNPLNRVKLIEEELEEYMTELDDEKGDEDVKEKM